jgi:hypothetical protein
MTYLQLVNDVLIRLRESQVASVTTNDYSTLIGKFVNDAKTVVENAWNWDALYTSISINTVAGTSTYTVTGSGLRQKQVVVNNTTNKGTLINVPRQWILDQQQLTTVQDGDVSYYAWNGNDGTDSKVTFFPTPDATETITFNMYATQAKLTADADVLLVPDEPVISWAYARALVERGEDGGLSSSEALAISKTHLAEHIALEATRASEYDAWEAV